MIFVDFSGGSVKKVLLRSMMNGVGVNKTDCPNQNKMTFSNPASAELPRVSLNRRSVL
jgi:hypothetical protein